MGLMFLVKFSKYHGLGNDFIVIDERNLKEINWPEVSRNLCRRHYGIGADGLILLKAFLGKQRIPQMQLFNADGSEAEMCGNGLRCFIHYLYDQAHISYGAEIAIDTKAGMLKASIYQDDLEGVFMKIDMGKPEFNPALIPVACTAEKALNIPIKIEGKDFVVHCVSTGPPHTVIFCKDEQKFDPLVWGPIIEKHPLFPAFTNVNFAKILSPREVNVKVWERGVGLTEACGTGACAVMASGFLLGHFEEEVTVNLPGGSLLIKWAGEDSNIFMSGPSRFVFSGNVKI